MQMKLIFGFMVIAILCGCEQDTNTSAQTVAKSIQSVSVHPDKDIIGIAVVVDCSGSMNDQVTDINNQSTRKIDIAKRSVLTIISQAEQFAKTKHANVELTVFSFHKTFTEQIPMQHPNLVTATPIINNLDAGGNTAIGDAVLEACKTLNKGGFLYKHIIVVTDGENTAGLEPVSVAEAFKQLPLEYQPKVYLFAFDVDSGIFNNVKQAGWMVLPAKDGQQLQNALDQIVSGEILLEK